MITSTSGVEVTHSVFDAPSSVILSLKNSSRAEKFEWLMPSAEISQTLEKKPSMFFIEPKRFSDNNWGLAKLGSLERAKADWDTVPLCLMQGPKFSSSAPVVFELPRMHLERSRLPLNVPRAPSVPRDISAPLRAPGSVQVEFPNAPPPQLAATKESLHCSERIISADEKWVHLTKTVVGKPHPVYEGVICYSDRIYVEHVKHKPNKYGKAAWKDASVNPISSYAEAQKLLDTAYLKSETEAFNIRIVKNPQGKIVDKQIIRFHYNNTENKWHGYELKKDFQNCMDDNIIQRIRKDKLINDAEYGKLIKNKWKK